jgi:hypothetical protein
MELVFGFCLVIFLYFFSEFLVESTVLILEEDSILDRIRRLIRLGRFGLR